MPGNERMRQSEIKEQDIDGRLNVEMRFSWVEPWSSFEELFEALGATQVLGRIHPTSVPTSFPVILKTKGWWVERKPSKPFQKEAHA
jgi:hypothetical protein